MQRPTGLLRWAAAAATCLALAACGGSGGSNDDDDAVFDPSIDAPAEDAPPLTDGFADEGGLASLWDASAINGVPVMPGTFYILFEAAGAPGVLAARFFGLEENANCYAGQSGRITAVDGRSDLYEDEVGDLLAFDLDGDRLVLTVDSVIAGVATFDLTRIVAIDASDLPACKILDGDGVADNLANAILAR